MTQITFHLISQSKAEKSWRPCHRSLLDWMNATRPAADRNLILVRRPVAVGVTRKPQRDVQVGARTPTLGLVWCGGVLLGARIGRGLESCSDAACSLGRFGGYGGLGKREPRTRPALRGGRREAICTSDQWAVGCYHQRFLPHRERIVVEFENVRACRIAAAGNQRRKLMDKDAARTNPGRR